MQVDLSLCWVYFILREWIHFQWKQLSNLLHLPSEKGSSLNGKSLLLNSLMNLSFSVLAEL